MSLWSFQEAKKYINAKKAELLNDLSQVDQKVDSVQSQLNQAVIEGDSSVEAAQARADINNKIYTTLKERLDAEQQDTITHAQDIEAIKTNTLLNNRVTGKRQCVVTFIADDGFDSYYNIIKPIFQSAGVPCTVAIIAGYGDQLTDEHMSELASLGWDFQSHTMTHPSLVELTDEQIEYQLKESKKWLEDKGYECTAIVYPRGDHNESVRKIAMKYYKCGITAQGNTNQYPLDTYAVKRVPLGDKYKLKYPNTLEQYMKMFNIAFKQKTWLVYMMHPGNPYFDTTQRQHLADLIDYIKSFDVPILGVNEAWKIVGNSFTSGTGLSDNLIITNAGDVIENQAEYSEPIVNDTGIWLTGTGIDNDISELYVNGGNIEILSFTATEEMENPTIVSVGKNVWGGLKACAEILAAVNDSTKAWFEVKDGKFCIALKGDSAIRKIFTSQPFLPNTQYTVSGVWRRQDNSTGNGAKFQWVVTDGSETGSFGPPSESWTKFDGASLQGKTVDYLSANYGVYEVTYIEINTLQIIIGHNPVSTFDKYHESRLTLFTTLEPNDLVLYENGVFYKNGTPITHTGKIQAFEEGTIYILPRSSNPIVTLRYPLNRKASNDIANK